MPKPRKHLISLDATSYYHCTSRCVRKAFLCGVDHLTGESYEHRRQWVEDRIEFLASVYCIDVCAYAVMSNHHHLVLHINKPESLALSDIDVCVRWHRLFKGTLLTQKFARGEPLTKAETEAVKTKLDQWRLQLCDISWFMRSLNEPIARMANAEDKCSGRFWESRFKSQALLDEKALLACMAYVDLNPIRAKMADTPEESEHTSIKKRIERVKTEQAQPESLVKFVGNRREPMSKGLPFNLNDYLELVDITGRAIREGGRGFIPESKWPILNRLGIEENAWLVLTTKFESRFKSLVGAITALNEAVEIFGFVRRPGLSSCQMLLQ